MTSITFHLDFMIGCTDFFLNGPLYRIKFSLKYVNIYISEITVLMKCDNVDFKIGSLMFCRNHANHFLTRLQR